MKPGFQNWFSERYPVLSFGLCTHCTQCTLNYLTLMSSDGVQYIQCTYVTLNSGNSQKKTIVYIVTLMLYVCMYRARIFTSVLFANIYARWKTIHLGKKKKIEKIVKLDNVLKHTIWVTSSRQTLQSMKTNKVRLKYAVKLGKFGLSVHIFFNHNERRKIVVTFHGKLYSVQCAVYMKQLICL